MITPKGEFTVADYIDAGPYYGSLSDDELRGCVNGMGPAWFPQHLRDLLDEHFDMFRDAVAIHDIGYTYGTTAADKVAEDERFLRNCRRCVNHHVVWWRHPFVFLEKRAVAYTLYLWVKECGDSAFWEGKMRYEN